MKDHLVDLWLWFVDWLIDGTTKREPDFIVGSGAPGGAYLHRWYLTPWRRWSHVRAEHATTWWLRLLVRLPPLQKFFSWWPNAYLHLFLRDDDDRALHDHPWHWCSILLFGGYIEHTIDAGGIHRRRRRAAPSIKFSGPKRAHRIELLHRSVIHPDHDAGRVPCWTLFITGPRLRTWGFHCPERGWVDFRDFTDPADTGRTGKGCAS